MISRNNSSRGSWRIEGVFSGLRQSRRHNRSVDEDEEVLKWAAIEKLPTYDRLRTSIMQFYEENGAIYLFRVKKKNISHFMVQLKVILFFGCILK